jgi:hypothetical protein
MTTDLQVFTTVERYVYEVRSERNPRVKYRVDIVAEGGATRCSCKDWNTRRWPNIKAGKPHGLRSTLCKHGIAARRVFLNEMLATLARIEEGQQ